MDHAAVEPKRSPTNAAIRSDLSINHHRPVPGGDESDTGNVPAARSLSMNSRRSRQRSSPGPGSTAGTQRGPQELSA